MHDGDDDETNNLSHDELLEATQSAITQLLISDTLLRDLPNDIATEEVQSQTAVERGKSITVFIHREEKEFMKVVVSQNAVVRNLKKAVERHFEFFQRRMGIKANISWKYIWKTFSLNYDSVVLDNNDAPIQEYGITNKAHLAFKKKRIKQSI